MRTTSFNISKEYCSIFSGHSCFGEYLHRIGAEDHAGCQKCGAALDSAQYTLEVCLHLERQQNILRGEIGTNLPLAAIVWALIGSDHEKLAITTFCENMIRDKEEERHSQTDQATTKDQVRPTPTGPTPTGINTTPGYESIKK